MQNNRTVCKQQGSRLKLRSVRRVNTFPSLGAKHERGQHEGEPQRMPGTLVIPKVVQSQGLSSPFSPLFDLELDSSRGARGQQWVERSWSEHHFQDGSAGGTTLQQILRLCRSVGAFQAQLGAHLQALRASHTGPRSAAHSPTTAGHSPTGRSPTASAAQQHADDPASTADAMDASSDADRRTTATATAPSSMQHGDAVDVEAIARELLALGYIVQIRDEAQQERTRDARSCLQNLRHRFIVCIGVDPAGAAPAAGASLALEAGGGDAAAPVGELQYLPEPLVVEPRFREQFLIAHLTPAYEALLQAVPQTFVGNLAKLEAVVKLLCAEMTAAFKAQSLSVPPWRSTQAMMSKWAPQQLQQLGVKIAELRRSIAGASPPEAVAPSAQQQAVACDGRAYYVAAYGSAPAGDVAEGVALRAACQHPSQPRPQQGQEQQQAGLTHAPLAPPTQQQQQQQPSWRPLLAAPEDGPSRMSLDGPETTTAGFRQVPLPHPSCPTATSTAATSSSASPASNASSAHSAGPSSGSASPYGTIRFTRKASAEFKQRASGKKMKSLLAVALRKSGSRAEAAAKEEAAARARSSSIRVSGDEPWSRITTVRWGGAAAAVVSEAGGAVANGVAALTNGAVGKANFQQLL